MKTIRVYRHMRSGTFTLLFVLSFCLFSSAAFADVTYIYTGNFLYTSNPFQFPDATPTNDRVTGSITFKSDMSDPYYPQLSDVAHWSFSCNEFTLTNQTGTMADNWPDPPFVIRNGTIALWDFGVESNPVGQYPIEDIYLYNPPLSSLVPYYSAADSVYDQGYMPVYGAGTNVPGQWTQALPTPLPPSLLFMASGLVGMGVIRRPRPRVH